MSKKSKKPVKLDTSFGRNIDSTLHIMEEIRLKNKHQKLINKLSNKLHFSYSEMVGLLIIFYKVQKMQNDFHSGVNKLHIRDILHCAFDLTDDHMMDKIFYAMDQEPSPFISLETWATNLSLFLRGTLDEKIKFCYSVYDTMGDGTLGKENLFHLLKNSIVSHGTDEETEETAKDMVEVISKKMDIDRDGKISFDDYKQSVLKQPMLLEAFGKCLPSRINVHTFMSTCNESEQDIM